MLIILTMKGKFTEQDFNGPNLEKWTERLLIYLLAYV